MENIALTDGGPMYCLMSALWIKKARILMIHFTCSARGANLLLVALS